MLLVGATSDSKLASQKDKKEKFENSEKFKKKIAIFCFIFLSLLIFELPNMTESVRKIVIFTLNVLMTVLYLNFFTIF